VEHEELFCVERPCQAILERAPILKLHRVEAHERTIVLERMEGF
jgi:hypothetical protein